MHRAVFVPPISVALVWRVPEAAFGCAFIKPLFEPGGGLAITRGLGFVAQQLLQAGPARQGPIHLGVDQCVLVRSPHHVNPIAGFFLAFRIVHHLDKPIAIGIAPEQIIQRSLARRISAVAARGGRR